MVMDPPRIDPDLVRGTVIEPRRRPRGAAAAMLRLARPRQWTKNLLVFAAPVAGRVIDHPGPLARATLAFVAFTLAAVAVYCVNDLRDLAADRLDPVKRSRPLASGALPARRAVQLALACTAGALAASTA